MKKLLLYMMLLFSLILLNSDTESPNFEGIWTGDISADNTIDRLVVKITKDKSAEADLPFQDLYSMPVDVTIKGNKEIEINIKTKDCLFSGILIENNKIQGFWIKNNKSYPGVIKKLNGEYTKPQNPIEPLPYRTFDIIFTNHVSGIELSGTMTYPESEGPFTAVVLISGSGPQNRDDELLGHRPFLVMADYLTRAGIAVLRFDDRGVGESDGNFAIATLEDFTEDVLSAVDFLLLQENIRINKIGLIGHSEGGLIAPMAAFKENNIDFIVLMAGPGCTGSELFIEQTEAVMTASGLSYDTVKRRADINKAVYSVINETSDVVESCNKVKRLLTDSGMNNENSEEYIQELFSPQFMYFLKHDPVPVLENITVPVLALFGTLDIQVDYMENSRRINNALLNAGNTDFTIKVFEGLNHFFQNAETGYINEYSTIKETISPEVLKYISNWINSL